MTLINLATECFFRNLLSNMVSSLTCLSLLFPLHLKNMGFFMVDTSLQSCAFPSSKIFKSSSIPLFGMTRAALGKEKLFVDFLRLLEHKSVMVSKTDT